MKTYKSNSDLIHGYAQQDETSGKCGNLFFENKKLYSYGYHYLLCEFISNNTVLINDSGYSVSTSKHISICSWATSQYKQFFTTNTDLKQVAQTVESLKNKLANARKPENYISSILTHWQKLTEFLEYTNAKKYKSNPNYKAIKKIVLALESNPDEYKEKLKVLAVKKVKAAKVKAAKQLKESLQKFENYEISSFRINNVNDHVRLSKCGQFVETSQNVKVSTKEAKVLYLLIQAKKDIKGHKIGYYTVISINGTLKIGCHNIDIKSMHKVGVKL